MIEIQKVGVGEFELFRGVVLVETILQKTRPMSAYTTHKTESILERG